MKTKKMFPAKLEDVSQTSDERGAERMQTRENTKRILKVSISFLISDNIHRMELWNQGDWSLRVY